MTFVPGTSELLSAEQRGAAMGHGRSPAWWTSANPPDAARGVYPTIPVIADDDSFTLLDQDGQEPAGNAAELRDGAFGELWPCDPEALATKASPAAPQRSVVIRFLGEAA